MSLQLSSKAKTLELLKEVITKAKVLPLIRFYAKDYTHKKQSILSTCLTTFSTSVIVRSSSENEDNELTSNAGGFDSVLNVSLEQEKLDKAILQVIGSYTHLSSKDEVFIQPMLKNVSMSGVIFTADLDTLAPYYIINFDLSGSTSSVTGGTGGNLETFISHKCVTEIEDKKLNQVIQASKECESIFQNNALDLEFAFENNELYILQVRAIVQKNKVNLSKIDLEDSLEKIAKKIEKLNKPHPNLLGAKTIFTVMSDWNPAEIIGIKPKKLALSLYKELVTDEIWAYQRDNYGYRNLRSHPLLVSFLGQPFIDVRVSFNSFIPADLEEGIARKLVNIYINKLQNDKKKHDKIEFDIIYSCYYFGINKKLQDLLNLGCTPQEVNRIEQTLLELTNNIIDTKNGLYKQDLAKVKILNKKYGSIMFSHLSIVDKIYWMIEDCKRYGTLPFAGVARAAFIAVQFLKSLVDTQTISKDDYHNFLNSLNTVSKELHKDKETLTEERFLEKYGHLRPGTYNIESHRYDENFEFYFDEKTNELQEEIHFQFNQKSKEKISKLLIQNGIQSNVEQFIIFLKEAIEGREYVKFVFTRHLSQILKYIEDYGNRVELNKKDLAYLNIQTIKNLYSTIEHPDVKTILENDINYNKEVFSFTQAVKLPSIISNEQDIYRFYMEENESNFVTLNTIHAKLVVEEQIATEDIKGCIVCIRSADPGYDYLFSKGIAGLVTCYGGANSHMAIRCAELNIPAVIGCGENKFKHYSKAEILFIDAPNKQVKIFQ